MIPEPNGNRMLGNLSVSGIVLLGGVLLLTSCQSRQTNRGGENPITSNRQVEYLDLSDGAEPNWKKEGELSVTPTLPEKD